MVDARQGRAASECRGSGLRVAGLFAGIGGLELGLREAGHHTVSLCENDVGALAVLQAKFPEVHMRHDVRDLRPRDLGDDVGVLTAGFPCQDLSQAGAVAGIAGDRSSLVGEVFRLLRGRKVPWVVLENVPFMLHLERGRAMQRVVDALEELGYRWAYRVVDAMAFGLPQRRRRVFLVASRVGEPERVLFSDEAAARDDDEWDGRTPVGFYWTEGNRGVGWAVGAIPTLKGGSGLGIPSPPAVLLPRGQVVTPTLRAVEQLQGFEPDWTDAADSMGRRRYRWRMVGNAVSVRAAAWLGARLATPGVFDEARVNGGLSAGDPWPRAARGRRGCRQRVEIGEWPERRRLEPISRFLKGAPPLSIRATEGFVFRARRAEREGKLTFPPGFLESLSRHSKALQTATS